MKWMQEWPSVLQGLRWQHRQPPEPEEIELVSVHVDGRDITHLFTAAEIEYVEGLLLCSECDEYNEPDSENYIDDCEYSNYN